MTTVKLFVSLKFGTPLSVTRAVRGLVPGPWASLGVQVKTPLTGWRGAPAGGLSRLNVRESPGPSGSVAARVRVKVAPSFTVWFEIAASTGGRFTEPTTAIKLLVSLSGGDPLSVTRTAIVFVLGA